MEINFNNLRIHACKAYDELCSKLNNQISDGKIEISASYIQKEMDLMRVLISAIAMCYESGNSNVTDVYSELYGEEGTLKIYNENI
jgi:hypothetical protein